MELLILMRLSIMQSSSLACGQSFSPVVGLIRSCDGRIVLSVERWKEREMSNKYCSNAAEIFISAERLSEMKQALIREAADNWGRDVNSQSSLEDTCDAFSWQISLNS